MAIKLISVPVNEQAAPVAGYAMRRVQNRAGTVKTINSAYRDSKAQEVLFNLNYTPVYAESSKTDRRVWNGKPYWRRKGKTVAVAVPGTSKHNQGTAFDIQTTSGLQGTLINHGAKHGFKRTILPSEPWHWEHFPKTDKWLIAIQKTQSILSVAKALNWGKSTDKAVTALRNASRYKNYGKTTAEKKYLQARVDVKTDGIIGPKTKKAVVEHTKQFQTILKSLGLYSGKVDGKWGAGTDKGYQTYRKIGYTP